MQLESARECFEVIASRGRHPKLVGKHGAWEFDLMGQGVWSIGVDDGRLEVTEGPNPDATARFRLRESDFVRMARGEDHENLITAVLRGALKFEGDPYFGLGLQAILPIEDEEGKASQ